MDCGAVVGGEKLRRASNFCIGSLFRSIYFARGFWPGVPLLWWQVSA